MVYTTLLLDFMLHIKVCDDKVVVWISGEQILDHFNKKNNNNNSFGDNCSKGSKIILKSFSLVKFF